MSDTPRQRNLTLPILVTVVVTLLFLWLASMPTTQYAL